MNRFTHLGLSILALALPGMSPAAVVTLSNNLANSPQYRASFSNSFYLAQGFTTTLAAYTITDVALLLSRAAATSGIFNISVFDSLGSGGSPGSWFADLAAVDASTLGTTAALRDFANLNAALAPSTTYYLVLRGVSLTGGVVYWNYTSLASGTGFPSNFSDSSNSGSTWLSPEITDPQKMRIQAAEAPEPTTLALLALGLAGLGARRAARHPG